MVTRRRRTRGRNVRLWLPAVANVVLAAFLQHACQMASACGVGGFWLQPDALYLVFPLLYFRFAHAVPQVVFTALALDAFWPGPYGTRLVLYLVAMLLMLNFRTRIRRENPGHVFWFTLVLNALLFAGLWLVAAFGSEGLGAVPLSRILGDMILSCLFAAATAYGWMVLQRWAIIKASGVDPAGFPMRVE